MLTLVEECMRRIGLHHQAFAGFIHVPLSGALTVPVCNCQLAFQHIEKLGKRVLMKWNTHARHNRHLKNGKGVACVFSQCPPQQLYRPNIQRRTACFVVLTAIWDVVTAPFLRCGASLKFKGELKRCPVLSVVGDEKRLVRFHRPGQLLKVGLGELSRQEVCSAIRMHRILHHSLVVIR